MGDEHCTEDGSIGNEQHRIDDECTHGEHGRATDGARSTAGRIGRRRYLTLASAVVGVTAVAGCTGSGSSGDGGGDSGGGGGGSTNGGGSASTSVSTETSTPAPASAKETKMTTGTAGGPTDTMVFIMTPGNKPGLTKKQWAPFVEYLEAEVKGLNVETQFAQSYAAAGQALKSGQAHMTSGDVIVLADPKAFDIVGISVEGGSSVYFSFICTRPTYEGVEKLTDLKGETIAFADPLSTSGSLFPTYGLKQAGLDVGDAPYGDPVDYTANYSNHDAVKQQLFNRADVTAGATYDGNIMGHIPRKQIPELVRKRSSAWGDTVGTKDPTAERLWNSAPIPNSPLVVASDWESPLREEITQAVLDIDPGTLRKPEGVELPLTSIAEGSIEDYQPVLKVINALDVDFGDV